MERVSEAEFRSWAAERGVRIGDPRYPYYPRDLSYPELDVRRFWENPDSKLGVSALHRAAIDCLRSPSSVVVWFRFRGLIRGAIQDPKSRPEAKLLLEPFREHEDSDGIRFSNSEMVEVLRLLQAIACHGWCVDWDAFVVPDHGDVILLLDHHDVLWAQFKSDAIRSEFEAEMTRRGWTLPTEYPDSTFKPMDWIEGTDGSSS